MPCSKSTARTGSRKAGCVLYPLRNETSTQIRNSLTVTGGTYDTAATNLAVILLLAILVGRTAAGQASPQPAGAARTASRPCRPSGSTPVRHTAAAVRPAQPLRRTARPPPTRRLATFPPAPTASRSSWARPAVSQWDVRFGWWAKSHSGSPAKVGEYQSLDSSPFWNRGRFCQRRLTRPLGVTATGSDNQDTPRPTLYYYRPGLSATVDYDRFLHQLDHDPLNNMATVNQTTPPAFTGTPSGYDPSIVKQDLGAGQDYAVRVQEFKSSFKVPMDDGNVKVRLDVWGLEKDGTRQVNAVAMCFTPNRHASRPTILRSIAFAGNRCHVLSQPQQIDWNTREVKPVIEARLGDTSVLEYSRPMRSFTADDSTTSRYYDSIGDLSYDAPPIRIPMTTPSCRTATRRWIN